MDIINKISVEEKIVLKIKELFDIKKVKKDIADTLASFFKSFLFRTYNQFPHRRI